MAGIADPVAGKCLAPRRAAEPLPGWPAVVEPQPALLQALEYDVLTHTEDELIVALYVMMRDLGVLDAIKCDKETAQRFLMRVRANYRNVPFHSFFHAAAVTQGAYVYICACDMRSKLSPLETAALILSAICHDLDHPGLNNTFLKTIESPLYVQFPSSTLENHHLSMAQSIIGQTGLFAGLDASEKSSMESFMKQIILATDLAQHKSIREALQSKRESGLDWSQPEDRILAAQTLMKCADIGNEARPFALSEKWAERIITEFFMQGDLERAYGYPLMNMMDRTKTTIPKEQVGFIGFVVAPLYEDAAAVFPQLSLAAMQLRANQALWKARTH